VEYSTSRLTTSVCRLSASRNFHVVPDQVFSCDFCQAQAKPTRIVYRSSPSPIFRLRGTLASYELVLKSSLKILQHSLTQLSGHSIPRDWTDSLWRCPLCENSILEQRLSEIKNSVPSVARLEPRENHANKPTNLSTVYNILKSPFLNNLVEDYRKEHTLVLLR
jgi:hypothetical protein